MIYGLKDTLTFGRHKGQVVEEVLKRDPGWMCWIRDEKRKNGQARVWDDAVNAKLDSSIMQSPALRRQYKPSTQLGKFDIKTAMQKAVDADAARSKAQEDLAAAYEANWGAW